MSGSFVPFFDVSLLMRFYTTKSSLFNYSRRRFRLSSFGEVC